MFSAPNDKDDPPIASNQNPIIVPYVDVPAERLAAAVPYATTSSATRGLTPISLPGSSSVQSSAPSIGIATVTTEPTLAESKKTEKKAKKKKKEKAKKERTECRESIEAVLVSPSSTTKDKSGKKESNEQSNVSLVSQSYVITAPPPFLFPTGTTNLPEVFFPADSRNWKLSGKLRKGCKSVDVLFGQEISRHRESHIPVESSEIVVYVSAKKDSEGGALAMYVENNSLLNMAVARNHRSAILTRGSLQFKKPSFSITQCVVYFKAKESPNINISLFNLRGIHVDDSSNNTVIVAYEKQRQHDKIIRYAVYQTPDTSRFLLPLAKAVVAAYIGVPQWAIPISWSGNLPTLPAILQHEYNDWIGSDGGFSSSVYAASLAHHVKHKLSFESFKLGSEKISAAIMKQQEKSRRSFQAASFGPQTIDPFALAVALGSAHEGKVKQDVIAELVLAGLNALCFNLVFRKFKLVLARFDRSDRERLLYYRNSLGRTLLYNVTIREVDFEMTNLSGFGETIGNAWAMNGENETQTK